MDEQIARAIFTALAHSAPPGPNTRTGDKYDQCHYCATWLPDSAIGYTTVCGACEKRVPNCRELDGRPVMV